MYPNPDLVAALEAERHREASSARLERIARVAGRARTAVPIQLSPPRLPGRVVALFRPAPRSCTTPC